jgi:hypothetical protein
LAPIGLKGENYWFFYQPILYVPSSQAGGYALLLVAADSRKWDLLLLVRLGAHEVSYFSCHRRAISGVLRAIAVHLYCTVMAQVICVLISKYIAISAQSSLGILTPSLNRKIQYGC